MDELSSEIPGLKIGGAVQTQNSIVSFPIFKNEDKYRGAMKKGQMLVFWWNLCPLSRMKFSYLKSISKLMKAA